MHTMATFLSKLPLVALFITIVLGYLIGKFKYKTFILGGIAGSLIMGVCIGQFDVQINPEIGSLFFALFIFAVGYQGGPQFFRSLNKKTLVQLISATLTCLFGLACVLISAYVFHLDRGTAAGLAAGGLTQSAMIGTASSALAKLPLSAEAIKTMQSNVAVGYAICYIFGSFGPILLLASVFPALMKWNLRNEAKALASNMDKTHPLLDPGQFNAIHRIETRVYQVDQHSGLTGKKTQQVFDHRNMDVAAIWRQQQSIDVSANTVIEAGDIIAVTAHQASFSQHHDLGTEIAKPKDNTLIEEQRSVLLSNKTFDGKKLNQFYQSTPADAHFGVFVHSVKRLGEELSITDDLILKRGDEIILVGLPKNLDKASEMLGKTLGNNKLTDFISFGLGLTLGYLIGMITVHFGDVAISIGSGGGCLFSGLIFGWIRSRHPNLSNLPEGASNFLRDFGLAVFVATVGISAGPQAITSIKNHGMELFLLGIFVTIVPQIIAFYVSYYLLKIKNPVTLLATIAGGRSANPGFAALLEKCGNSTPIVPFTATYAVANIWLTLWGPIIVALVSINVH